VSFRQAYTKLSNSSFFVKLINNSFTEILEPAYTTQAIAWLGKLEMQPDLHRNHHTACREHIS